MLNDGKFVFLLIIGVVWSWMIPASELELRAGDNKDHHYVSVVWLMIYTIYFMSINRIIKVTAF